MSLRPPNFQGVFSQSEGKLGQAVRAAAQRDVGQALNFSIQQGHLGIAQQNLNLRKKQQELKERAIKLQAAQEANMAPFKIAKLEQDLRKGETDIFKVQADIKDKIQRLNVHKAEFITDRLGSVDDPRKLETANKALIGLGILDKPIETVGQARLLFEGSQQHILLQKQRQAVETAKNKQEAETKLKQEQARLGSILERDRDARGFTNAVTLEKLKQRGRQQLVQQKAEAGVGNQITNVNVDPNLFQGLPQRQTGGRVGPETELDRLNREATERGKQFSGPTQTFEQQLKGQGIDTSLKGREQQLGVNRQSAPAQTFEQQLQSQGIPQFKNFEEQIQFQRQLEKSAAQAKVAADPTRTAEERGLTGVNPSLVDTALDAVRRDGPRHPREFGGFDPQAVIDQLAREGRGELGFPEANSTTQVLPARQTGGEVGNGAFIVGENSPEVFIPDEPGTVVPTNPVDQATGLAQGNISPEQVQLANNVFDPTGGAVGRSEAEASRLRQEINAPAQQQETRVRPSLERTDGINAGTRRQIINAQAKKGRIPVDTNDLNKGFRDLPGTQQKTPEAAAKIQMLRTGLEAADNVEDLIFTEDGSVDRTNLLTSDVPVVGSVPFTKGRELRTKMEFGIQAITRAETGAAMPPSEVENTRIRFMPRAGDSDSVIKLKMKMFRDFLGGSLDLMRKGDVPGLDDTKFQSEFATRAKDDFKQRFLQANPGATPADAEQFIKSTKKSFLPQ